MELTVKSGKKWVAHSDASGVGVASAPHLTKKAAQAWLVEHALEAKVGSEAERLTSSAIVKGIIEHNDGTSYFGSTGAYAFHFANAVSRGLVTKDKAVTFLGSEWYERCLKKLPQCRLTHWTDGVGAPQVPADASEIERYAALIRCSPKGTYEFD
jgi:hypothetical protein